MATSRKKKTAAAKRGNTAVKTAKARPAAKSAKSAAKNGGAAPARWWGQAVQFMREVKNELKKVTWPSRKQTITSTGVVLVLVLIVAVFLGLVDMVLARLVRLLIS